MTLVTPIETEQRRLERTVREYRSEHNLSQPEFVAELKSHGIEVSQQLISRLERSITWPRHELKRRMLRYFGIMIEDDAPTETERLRAVMRQYYEASGRSQTELSRELKEAGIDYSPGAISRFLREEGTDIAGRVREKLFEYFAERTDLFPREEGTSLADFIRMSKGVVITLATMVEGLSAHEVAQRLEACESAILAPLPDGRDSFFSGWFPFEVMRVGHSGALIPLLRISANGDGFSVELLPPALDLLEIS